MTYTRNLFIKLSASIYIFTFLSMNALAEEYLFIVNANNANTAEHQEIRQLYLKEKTTWADGTKVKPLGPSSESKAYQSFVKNILNMDSAELVQHWLRAKQMTGQSPPREIKSDRLLIKLVEKDVGAFAVITKNDKTELTPGVKVLFSFE